VVSYWERGGVSNNPSLLVISILVNKECDMKEKYRLCVEILNIGDGPEFIGCVEGGIPRLGDLVAIFHAGSAEYPYLLEGAMIKVEDVIWSVSTEERSEAAFPTVEGTFIENCGPAICDRCNKKTAVVFDVVNKEELDGYFCLECRKHLE